MANSSLIGVPTDFKDLGQIRIFLMRLIEKLDVILGLRASSKYISAKDLAGATLVTSSALEDLKELLELQITALEKELTSTEDRVDDLDDRLSTGITITPVSYVAPTVDVAYVQSEVQGIADSLEDVADTLDTLIGALVTAGVLS